MAKKQDIIKKTKKKWYNILASKEFKDAIIGESYVDDINLLKGRMFKVSLMNIVNDLKKQNINASFLVNEIKGDHASATLVGYEVTPSYIKRIGRKSKTKVEDSFRCTSSDKVNVVVKTIVLAKSKINNSVSTALRKGARKFLTEFLKKNSFEEFTKATIFGNLQKELRDKLNKITPLSVCLVRVFKKI